MREEIDTLGAKVLVVDDSNAIRSQVSAALGAAGFEVFEAKDGMDAMNKIMGAVELDLVVCDLNMPYIDGLKLVQFVKEHDRHAGLPFAAPGATREERVARAACTAPVLQPRSAGTSPRRGLPWFQGVAE